MGRLVYINGKFVKEEEAYISIFDRGFLFSDAIYEVTAVIDKKLVSWEGHLSGAIIGFILSIVFLKKGQKF